MSSKFKILIRLSINHPTRLSLGWNDEPGGFPHAFANILMDERNPIMRMDDVSLPRGLPIWRSGSVGPSFRVSVKFMWQNRNAQICRRRCRPFEPLSNAWGVWVEEIDYGLPPGAHHPMDRAREGNFPANRAGKPIYSVTSGKWMRLKQLNTLLLLMESKFEAINRNRRTRPSNELPTTKPTLNENASRERMVSVGTHSHLKYAAL